MSEACVNSRIYLDSPGLASWTEVVNLVMGESPRIPTLEVGLRLKQTAELSRTWQDLRRMFFTDPGSSEETEGWPIHDIVEFSTRLSRLPVHDTKAKPRLDALCNATGEFLSHWRDYDRKYQIAQSVVLEAVRQEKAFLYASRSPKRGTPPFQILKQQLMESVKVDKDRRHLVADVYGELYPRTPHSPGQLAAFYNAKFEKSQLREHAQRLVKRYEALSRSLSVRKRLSKNPDLEQWYGWFVAPFKRAGAAPTEAQLILALRIEWPDHTGHREVARDLVRTHGGRPMGAPRKSPPHKSARKSHR